MPTPLRRVAAPAAAMLLLLGVWQTAVSWGHVESWILPSPLGVAQEMAASWARLWLNTQATLELAIAGFVIGIAAGVGLAIVLHVLPGVRAGLYPLLVLSQNVPIVVLAPLLVVWMGFGLLPKLVLVILVCFFPVAVAMMSGMLQTDQKMLDYMRMIGATRGQILLRLELPHALPYLFSGLKIAATYCVMGAVIAEWLGSEHGIGQYLLLSERNFRTDRVFAALFIIVGLSLLLFAAIGLVESRAVRWKREEGRSRDA